MENREDVIKALDEGQKLTSKVTGMQYTLIDGKLHARNSQNSEWQPSELHFDNPPSWVNLQI